MNDWQLKMQMSQISFSNELYSGGDVVARGDQSSDDSVYEVQHNSSNSRKERTRKLHNFTGGTKNKYGPILSHFLPL